MSFIQFSLVIPIKDEEECLPLLFDEIKHVMPKLAQDHHANWEVIAVDDGSKDNTLQVLQAIQKSLPELHILSFENNAGQSAAFDAGFKKARGKYVITLDADGQNDPADIPLLVNQIEDHDLVCGWRKNRHDPANKRWISKLANTIRSRICKDGLHDTGCSLKVFKKEALNHIKLFKGMHRFFPALFAIEGFKIKEVVVNHRAREKGKSKYHFFNRSIGPMVDTFVVWWMWRRKLSYKIKLEQ